MPRFLSNILKYIPLSIAALLIFFAGVVPGWKKMQSDFPNYWLGSRLVTENPRCDRLYDNAWFQEQLAGHGFREAGKFSPFPPPTVFLFLPLTPFAPLEAKRIWMVVNLLLLAGTIRAFHRISGLSPTESTGWVLATGLALINNLYLGQVYLLAVAVMLYGWIFFRSERKLLAGTLFGLITAVKYFPLVVLPEWLMQRRWKPVSAFAGTLLVLGAASLYAPGPEACNDFFRRVVFAHLDGKLEGQSPFATAFQSWNALFHRLFLFDADLNPTPWFHSPLLLEICRHLVPAALLLAGGRQAWRLSRIQRPGLSVAIVALTVLTASPASASYHLLLVLFPLALLTEQGEDPKRTNARERMILLSVLACTGWAPLFIGKFLHPETWPVLLQFYRLWLLSALWLTGLYVCRKAG